VIAYRCRKVEDSEGCIAPDPVQAAAQRLPDRVSPYRRATRDHSGAPEVRRDRGIICVIFDTLGGCQIDKIPPHTAGLSAEIGTTPGYRN